MLDSQDRENEGDLIVAAESITAAQMAFLVRYSRYETHPTKDSDKRTAETRLPSPQ